MKDTIKINYDMKKTGDKVERKVILNRFYKSSVKPYTDACAIPAKCDMCDSYEIEGYYARPFSDAVQVRARPTRELPARTKEEMVEQALTKPRARARRTYKQQQKARDKSAETVMWRKRKLGLLPTETDYSGFVVADLKAELRKRRLKVGGRKDELIDRLKLSDARRGDFKMGEAPDIQAIGRKGFEEKRQKRSAFKRRQDARRARKPSTRMFVADPKALTGVKQIRRKSEPKAFTRIPTYSKRDIEGIQKAVEKLEKKEYKNMKVTELRDELRERGLKVSGTKKELIKRLS